jgi:glycosyltransferase involved in cell wall biosynthesis
MTKIIVLNHYPVLPAQNGGQCTVRAITRELALGWPTELVWIERKTEGSRLIEEGDRRWTVTVLPNLWRQRKVARWLRHGIGCIDSDVGTMLFSAGNRRLIEYLLSASNDGDVFLLAHPWLWPALRVVLKSRRATLIYDAHNVEYVLKQEALRPSALTSWLVERTRAMEAELAARADLTLVCTKGDADELSRLASLPSDRMVVGLRGVEPAAHAGTAVSLRSVRPFTRRAVFVGSKHPPNDLAARWIIESLAPSLPDWQFDIAGACGPACGAQPQSSNVRVLGYAEDLSALLAQSDIALNPITTGSGVNMKLFDYMQHGLPVLSTPFGARGLEGTEPNGVVVAPLEGYATALDSLASNVPLQRQLSAQGVACVHEHFEWPGVGRRLRGIVTALLQGDQAALAA